MKKMSLHLLARIPVIVLVYAFGLYSITSGQNIVVGSGIIVEQSRNVPMFSVIASESPVPITVTTNIGLKNPKVVVRADNNIIPLIVTNVQGGTFHASLTGPNINAKELMVLVEIPVLEKVEHHGASAIVLNNVVAETLALVHAGAGEMRASGKVKKLVINFEGCGSLSFKDIEVLDTLSLSRIGAGTVKGSGKANKLVIDSEGPGDISLENMKASDCDVVNRGNGNVKVKVAGNLNAKALGIGNIIYYGTPTDIKSEQSEQDWLGKVKQGSKK